MRFFKSFTSTASLGTVSRHIHMSGHDRPRYILIYMDTMRSFTYTVSLGTGILYI